MRERADFVKEPDRRLSLLGLAFFAALLAATTPIYAREIAEPTEGAIGAEQPSPSEGASEAVRYETIISGVDDRGLLGLLRAASQLKALQDRPPATLARLLQRIKEDMKRLETALHSEGYYDATLHPQIDEKDRPIKVTIGIEPGERYRFAALQIDYRGESSPPEHLRPTLDELGIEPSQAARAPAVVAAQGRWLTLMTQRGYPLARVMDRKATINREDRTLKIVLTVDSGPEARFGTVIVTGLEQVEESHVRRMLPWEAGDIYDSRKVEEARRRLSASDLFASVTIHPADATDPDGSLPLTLQLMERPHRSIGFGASWSTDVGYGGKIFWEHRNLFGSGEQLHLNLAAAQIEQTAEARFRKPDFRTRDQDLLGSLSLKRARTDAFDENSLTAFAGMEFRFAETWRASAGVAPEFDDLVDESGNEWFVLVGMPLALSRDSTDDRLNPTGGTRLSLTMTPYYGDGETSVQFLSSVVGGSAYYAVDSRRRFVLAGRARAGSLVGESAADLPANKRFYAGGGGSIRGYEFQSVGPLDAVNDPLGGRSLVELSAEMRARVTDEIGLVPFVDGGSVFEASYPDFDRALRWSAGIGLRYFTGVGPVRVDFAFPIDRRNFDQSFQFYVSFGQAF